MRYASAISMPLVRVSLSHAVLVMGGCIPPAAPATRYHERQMAAPCSGASAACAAL